MHISMASLLVSLVTSPKHTKSAIWKTTELELSENRWTCVWATDLSDQKLGHRRDPPQKSQKQKRDEP
ncbi:hypothetical protein CEXT_109491 [Caerostris extrusa]|uniref:Secreted protein n=1 Tax=Caerostris extrusa TaxID=172846 RepID=A0AAV4WT45_CAEEX|nr:hypothetical protein CEXT_109491 [Caerostris extrusa]